MVVMRKLTLLLAATWTLGCGAEPSEPQGGGLSAECVQLLPNCLENQQTCEHPAAGPRCVPCPAARYPEDDGSCVLIPGQKLSHDFPELTTPSGEESLGLCRSWTLSNDAELWINAVELEQTESSHHSNWTFVPDDQFTGPDGVWPCKERNYDQLTGALAGGVIYAQSTQAVREVQKFPPGVVVRIPPRSRIISDIHVLNTTPKEAKGHAKLSLYAIDLADVTVKLAPFHVTYDGLEIPPTATSRFTGECAIDEQFESIAGRSLDMKVYYVLPHTHALGSRFFLEHLGGSRDGETVIDVRGFNGEARGRRYDPPVDMTGAVGLRFGCEFDNPRSVPVGWGFDDQEMCEALGFAESPVAFESRVSAAHPGPSDGVVQTFSAPCQSIVFPWDQSKAGGSP